MESRVTLPWQAAKVEVSRSGDLGYTIHAAA
jgi:hypothetical protein